MSKNYVSMIQGVTTSPLKGLPLSKSPLKKKLNYKLQRKKVRKWNTLGWNKEWSKEEIETLDKNKEITYEKEGSEAHFTNVML